MSIHNHLSYCKKPNLKNVTFFIIDFNTVYQRTPDIAICEVETVSKDAIPGQYFPKFLSHCEVFNLKQTSMMSLTH